MMPVLLATNTMSSSSTINAFLSALTRKEMAVPTTVAQSNRIRQTFKDKQDAYYSVLAEKWRSYTVLVPVQSAPVAATSVTTSPPRRTSPSLARLHDKMAVATTPSLGAALPTAQFVPASTIVLPDPGLAAITSLDAGLGIQSPSSSLPSFIQYPSFTDVPPSTISTVTIRIPTTINSQPLTIPKPRPQYPGAGNLLTSTCTQAEYTLVDAGSSLYYVPFVGCINQKPDCCPFAPGPTAGSIYPQPLDKRNALLEHCPSDYHSVSGGGCCPSGYTPWTAPLGGQTPCFSSILARRTPEATGKHPGRATTGKPTVVVSDAVFSMQFSTEEQPSGGLSSGAIAGVVIGVLGGLILSAGLAWVLIRRHRAHNPPAIDLKSENGGGSSYRATPTPALPEEDTIDPTSAENRRETSELSNFCRSLGPAGFGRAPPPSYEEPVADQRLRDEEPLQIQVSHPRPKEMEVDDLSQKPTPLGDHDDLDEGFTFESGASSPVQESAGILEVQLARPQRLSRGYARIVYNNQGSGSSIHTDGKSIRSNLTETQ